MNMGPQERFVNLTMKPIKRSPIKQVRLYSEKFFFCRLLFAFNSSIYLKFKKALLFCLSILSILLYSFYLSLYLLSFFETPFIEIECILDAVKEKKKANKTMRKVDKVKGTKSQQKHSDVVQKN